MDIGNENMVNLDSQIVSLDALVRRMGYLCSHFENLTKLDINAVSPCATAKGAFNDMAKRYRQRVDLGFDEQGKPLTQWVQGVSQQEMLRNAATLLIQAGCLPGIGIIPQEEAEPVLFKPYAQRWMGLYKVGKRKHTTIKEYDSILRGHLYPAFGERDIRSITIDCVQEFLNGKTKYTAKTIREMRLVLGMVLESAREDGIITMNPARSKKIAIPAGTKAATVREPLTPEQAADIIAHMNDIKGERDRRFLALLLYTGMRRNEVLGLQGGDIDFGSGLLHVRRGVTFKGNAPVVDTPKTAAGVRTIPIHPDLAPHLQGIAADAYVISETNQPITRQAFVRMWERIGKEINMYGKTPHHFRHTFVTFGRRAGIDEKTLQTIGGYADIQTMRSVYGHTQDKDIQIASRQMQQMFVQS